MDRLAKIHRTVGAIALGTLIACAAPDRSASAGATYDRIDTGQLEAAVRVIQADIDAKRFPGAVLLVARGGRTVFERPMGLRDPASGAPMTADTIFRLYSMTKPITSVAAMMLVEEGQLELLAPVSRYLPEFRDLQVAPEAKGGEGAASSTVAAKGQMTVHDLLRNTAGLTYPGTDSMPAKELVRIGIYEPDPGSGWVGVDGSDDFVRKVARAPLTAEPGTTWQYGFAADILGVLIERISGKTLDVVLEERIFKPLGMADTAFWVVPPKLDRVAQPFPTNVDTGQPIRLWNTALRAKFLGGGGRLTSTPRDYLRFMQMLLNGGEIDGVRILSRRSVAFMTMDHLGGMTGPAYYPGPGYGFGLGFAVRLSPGVASFQGTVGDYHWMGFGGTAFWVDPHERLIVVFMIQAPGQQFRYLTLLRNVIYPALR